MKTKRNLIQTGLLLAALPFNALAGTFADSFSNGLDPNYWSIIQTTTNLYSVNATQGNVQLAKTSAHNPGGVQDVYARVNLAALSGAISNDFSTQVSFSGAVVPGPGLDQVELHTYYQDGSIFFTVYDRSSGLNVHVWDGGSVRGARSVSGNSGMFLITRTGSEVSGYFDGTLIYSTVRSSPMTAIEFVLQNNAGSDDQTSVTFDNFSVSGPSVPDTAPFSRQWTTNTLPPGLISWWNADGNTLDVTGVNPAASSGQTYAPGRFGQAFHFNGVNQSVTAPGSASLDQWPQFTLEAWMKLDQTADPNDDSPGRMVINRVGRANDQVNFNQGYQFGFWDNARRLVLNFNTNGQAWIPSRFVTEAVLPAPLPTNVWLHVAATYDHNAVILYLNGVPLKTNVIGAATVAHSTSSFRIGMDDNGNCPFLGSIDDVRVYNRALTAAEITGLCAGPNPPVNQPLLKHVTLGDGKLTFEWDTISNQNYHVECATNLANPSWQRVGWQPSGDLIIATNTAAVISYPVGGEVQRFYRVVTP